ncbi:MAG: energy transducer TonB [Chthoniobacterales bacterium]
MPAQPHGTQATSAVAIEAPRPEYPEEARKKRMQGGGVFKVDVDTATGRVRKVAIEKTTGHDLLDRCAVKALRRWRFKPGTATTVRVPLTFVGPPAEYWPVR